MGALLSDQLHCRKCGAPKVLLRMRQKGIYKASKKVVDTRFIEMIARCPKHGGSSLTMPFAAWNDDIPTVTEHILLCDKCGQPATPLKFDMGKKISTIKVQCPKHGVRKRQISTTLASPVWQYASNPPQPAAPTGSDQTTKESDTLFCEQCGIAISPTAFFCPGCGSSIEVTKD